MDDLEAKAVAIVETLSPEGREEWLRYDEFKEAVTGSVNTMTAAVMGVLDQTMSEGPERAEVIEQIITRIVRETTQAVKK